MARPRYLLGLFTDSYVPVVTQNVQYNIDNEQLTVSGITVYRQRTITCSPTNPNGKQEVGAEGAAMCSDGGLLPPVRILSGTSTAQIIKNAAGRLCRLINPKLQATTVTISFYDDPNGNANNLLFTWQPQPGDILNLQLPCVNGITAIPSGATIFDLLIEKL